MKYRVKSTCPSGELTTEWFSNTTDACISFVSMMPKSTQLLTAFALGEMIGSTQNSGQFDTTTIIIEEEREECLN
jgi:hypothetical protein